ncbi:hypothetical protein MATL_G00213460 [Megalops atlanticus]|uniref:Uncharacterized protein n=1 Tax=Megalops atlanticus TaxID=7932 RepID=A0A9D3SXP8_MEGAT|nr:hypothetical protein MATL_G00213460 [Megalops atlanticus]
MKEGEISANRSCEPKLSVMTQPQLGDITDLGAAGLGLMMGAAGGYVLGTTTSAEEEAMESLINDTRITNTTQGAFVHSYADTPVFLSLSTL